MGRFESGSVKPGRLDVQQICEYTSTVFKYTFEVFYFPATSYFCTSYISEVNVLTIDCLQMSILQTKQIQRPCKTGCIVMSTLIDQPVNS